MISSTDQLGKTISLGSFPKRIISLVPSQTELLYDLGLNEEVVGITKFCIYPASWLHVKEKIGGTKNLNIRKISGLKPDLVIANKEENLREEVEEIEALCPVWTSDISSLETAITMIAQVSALTSRTERGNRIINEISIQKKNNPVLNTGRRVAYIIWNDPLMTVGADTFIHSMLVSSGLVNVFDDQKRYPEISFKDLAERNPDLIFLSSEPFPFAEKHQIGFQQNFPGIKILLVDGSMFSWYGSRMLYAGPYIKNLLTSI